MASVWSFNTTVRNPERVQNFLRALKDLEGVNFDEKGQERFFGLQIKKRLYKPFPRTLKKQSLIDEISKETAEEVPDNVVSEIIEIWKKKKVNGSARGRTTAGVLNKFGLCVALKTKGPVVITDLGKKWLGGEIQDQELFTKFFLKWQYPNPLVKGYLDFDIKPFVGTLMLIDKVNNKWRNKGFEPVGVTKKEFGYFIPSLKKYSQVEEYSEKIIKLRLELKKLKGVNRRIFKESFYRKRAVEIFNEKVVSEKRTNSLKDYTDSIVRYFRVSGFIYLRGKGHFIDNSPDRKIEIAKLLDSTLTKPLEFETDVDYLNYLAKISSPKFPWESDVDLERVKIELFGVIEPIAEELNKETELAELLSKIESVSLIKQVKRLRDFKNILQISKLKNLKYDSTKLVEFIQSLSNLQKGKSTIVTTRPSLDLEWFTSLCLIVLNDAIDILPSYKLGDDGIPVGFASNTSDIECFYETFGMIVEVTLLMGRDQWHAEGFSVQRHLRDFEKNNIGKYSQDDMYCLFIAPLLHRDTMSSFWSAVKGVGYEGKTQKIIPITIVQFVKIAQVVNELLENSIIPSHLMYKKLFDSICSTIESSQDVMNWTSGFDELIDEWEGECYEY